VSYKGPYRSSVFVSAALIPAFALAILPGTNSSVSFVGKWGNTQGETFAWRATAVAIGPRHVLTANHNLFILGVNPPTYVQDMQFKLDSDNTPFEVVQVYLVGFGDLAIAKVDRDLPSYRTELRRLCNYGNGPLVRGSRSAH
jgi:hypothetical protein